MAESKDGARSSAGGGEELPQRWSAKRKAEIVLRLPRGDDLGEVSREIQVPAHELEGYMTPAEVRDSFVQKAA